jgi:hypothetical protein
VRSWYGAGERAILGLLYFDLLAIEGELGVAAWGIDFEVGLTAPVASECKGLPLVQGRAYQVRPSYENTLVKWRMRVVGEFRLPRLVGRAPIHEHNSKPIVEGEDGTTLVLQEADHQPSFSFVEFHILAAIADSNLPLLHALEEELAGLSSRYPQRDQRLSILHNSGQNLCRRVNDLLRPSIEIRHKHLGLPAINSNVRRVLRDCQISQRRFHAQLERLEAGQRGVGVLGYVEARLVVDVVKLLGEDGGVAGVVCRAVAAFLDLCEIFGGAQEEAEELCFGVFVADCSGLRDRSAVVVARAL